MSSPRSPLVETRTPPRQSASVVAQVPWILVPLPPPSAAYEHRPLQSTSSIIWLPMEAEECLCGGCGERHGRVVPTEARGYNLPMVCFLFETTSHRSSPRPSSSLVI